LKTASQETEDKVAFYSKGIESTVEKFYHGSERAWFSSVL
jgi:hypothetical protein